VRQSALLVRAAAIALLCITGLCAASASARPTVAKNGLIAFMRPGQVGEYDIWVVRPTGKGLRRLTPDWGAAS
jgi:hypothetical protein